jgi:retron-type reverse transcriptase
MPKSVHNLEFEDKGWGGFKRERDAHRKNCTIRLSEILTYENILKAWEDFVKGKRKRDDVHSFAIRLGDNLLDVFTDLKKKTYTHGLYQEYIVYDPKKRIIHKASVRDRVVHRFVYNALYSYFNKRYIHDSYSCRIGKGTHKAYDRFRKFANNVSKNYTKPCWVLKFDIKKCFESIDRDVLKMILSWHIADTSLRDLVFHIVDSFERGLPLGNLTSQLFINVYLHELDIFAKKYCFCRYYLRYADDIIIVSESKKELEGVYCNIREFLGQGLKLIAHKKVVRSIYSGVDVLGIVFFPKYTRLRRSTERRRKVREGKSDDQVALSHR